ncbi:MAG: hypothetical protein ACYC59_03030 [Anaerolineaceae bacterium]
MKTKILFLLICTLGSLFLLAACGGGKEEGVTIESVTFAESLDANYQPINATTQFHPTDTIYASVKVTGAPKTGILTGQFYYYDQLISEASIDFSTVNEGVIISFGQNTYVGFNLTPSATWPVDSGYTLKLLVDTVEVGSYAYEVIE